MDHDALSSLACGAAGVASMTDLTDAQMRDLVRELARPVVAPPPSAVPASRRRAPRGRPAEAGVVRMATPRQRDYIHGLASAAGWSQSHLHKWLQHHFGLATVAEIPTVRAASDIINALIGWTGCRPPRGRSAPWGHREAGG
jgi:hypothetical protein